MANKAKPLAKAAMEGQRGLGVDGKSRPRVRRQAKRTWTKAKERAFFAMLAESCNVLMAAKAAGVRPQRAYDRRAADASFRASWDRALAEGYRSLELMMLQRALHGVEKTVVARDGTTTVMREYSDRVALALLRMHRETAQFADERIDETECDDARERIVERLARIRARDEEEEDKAFETKAAVDRIALIRRALRQA